MQCMQRANEMNKPSITMFDNKPRPVVLNVFAESDG